MGTYIYTCGCSVARDTMTRKILDVSPCSEHAFQCQPQLEALAAAIRELRHSPATAA